ncbi:hypothetical protein N431DRAFT_354655 [Stipitochalara longipes BDJ]|nr:hypothetical protein N431DRAFT_354655 [Stipitochalara longipes BDJ]
MSYISPFAPPSTSAGYTNQVVAASSRVTPTAEDWERHRPLIKRLYVDERMKLKEVVAIMASQHGHIATPKMYKDRINKWRLDKKNKESDMLAILRKKTQREAIGKRSSFRVRGQPVSMEEVLQYFKRKKNMRDEEAYNAPTPSDVSCRTPSPTPAPVYLEDYDPVPATGPCSWADRFAQAEGNHYPSTKHHSYCTELNAWVIPPAGSAFDSEQIIQWTLEDMYNVISREEGIPRSPSTPQTLLVPERLFFTIKTYLDSQFQSRSWITDENGFCTVRNTPEGVKSGAVDFYTSCISAVSLLESGQLVEFRRLLAKAFRHAETLIRIQHPRTLDLVIEITLFLKRRQHPEIVKLLLGYLVNLSTIVWTKDHYLTHIWRLVGMLEEDELEQTVIQSWRCTVDNFEKGLGQFHSTSLWNNLRFIGRVYSPPDAEPLLRTLLAQYEEKRSNLSNVQTLEILRYLAHNLLKEGRYAEAEQLGFDIVSRAEEQEFIFYKTDSLRYLAYAQYYQNKRTLSENNLRRALQLAVDSGGIADPLSIDCLLTLEQWLREWGREDEADKLKEEIDVAIGRDEIDEEFDGQ